MKKVTDQLIVTIIFIVFLPLIALELILIRSNNFVTQIILTFQLLLFVIDLGCEK